MKRCSREELNASDQSDVWDAIFLDTFGKQRRKHWFTIRYYIEAVNCGIKPAYLWDVFAVPAQIIVELMATLKKKELIGGHVVTISIADDVFVINIGKVSEILEGLISGNLKRLFIDITSSHKSACLANYQSYRVIIDMLRNVAAQLDGCLAMMLEITIVDVEDDWSIPTIVGVILGYPVVYWYSNTGDNSKLSISDTPLVVNSVKAKVVFGSSTHISTHRELYSFSVPLSLLAAVDKFVIGWFKTEIEDSTQKIFSSLKYDNEIKSFTSVAL